MRKLFTIGLFMLVLGMGVSVAQSNVYLHINHKLSGNNFAFSSATTNNLGDDFDVSRLQYYVAEVTLIHDGGTRTLVPNYWIFADAGTQVNEMLGSFNITTLEAIEFGIGVEQAANHLDPSSYPMTHPLAPKSPSMHWGWTSGYRFVAMEGNSGSGLSQIWQIHALGDDNYFTATVNTAGIWNGNDLDIWVDGNYEQALKNITVSSGPITHGENGEALVLLQNFSRDVFTEGSPFVGVNDVLDANISMTLAPNPSNGTARVNIEGEIYKPEIRVTDVSGRVLQHIEVPASGSVRLENLNQGIYFVTLSSDGIPAGTHKLVVTR